MTDRFRGLQSSVPELVRQRELLGLAARRQVGARYRRSVLGLAWVVLTPVLTALVMFTVFRTLFEPGDVGGWPFLAYVFSGVAVFACFSQTSLEIAPSLRANGGILTRTTAAPEVFVLSTVASGLFGIVISSLILTVILTATGHAPGLGLLALPAVLLVLGLLATGVGALLSHLSIQYEDVGSLATVLMSILAYLTPSFYPITVIPDSWRRYYELNPLVGLLDLYRASFGFPATVGWFDRCWAIGLSVALGVGALHSFRRRWPRVVAEL